MPLALLLPVEERGKENGWVDYTILPGLKQL
jgi:hypothetical protein